MATDLTNLSISELKKIKKDNKQKLKEEYKQRLIDDIKKIQKTREKIKSKPKQKPKPKSNSYKDYFQECIKNKTIPPDAPSYLRKALERALREYEQGIEKEKSSLEGFANKYIVKGQTDITPFEFFKSKAAYLKEFLRNHRNIKVRFVLVCMMEQMGKSSDGKSSLSIQDKAYFNSETHINLESSDVKEILTRVIRSIIEKIAIYQKNGSGWYFREIIHLEIHTADYNPMRGSSYIPLPDWIMRKKAILSIRNKDEKCFLWCVLRYLHPRDKNDFRLTDLKQYENSLNTKGIAFPVKLKDISKFEKLNPDLPGINVFSVNERNKFYPLRMAQRDPQKTIDLFLFEKEGRYHYSLIKSFSRLFRSQITSRTNGRIHICKRCFSHFSKEELFQRHIEYCSSNESVVVKIPPKNSKLEFKNYFKKLPIPFVVYADFECFTKSLETCKPNPAGSYTLGYQKHEPSGFCFYIKGIVPNIFKPICFTKQKESDNVAEIFVSKLTKVTQKLFDDFYRHPKPLRLTEEEQKSFKEARICHICLGNLDGDRVRDHCHFTGQYRGAAHNSCNLQCKKPLILPVIFHNLQGYDAHLFIKQLSGLKGELNCIPSTEEKYISFSKKIKVDEYRSRKTGEMVTLNFELRFIDSFKFLQTSLANLVGNLQPDDFQNTKEIMKDNIELLTRKGVYPYDYVSSLEKLTETQLPTKEKFYSKLNDEDISDEDYSHAINVWNTFKCQTIRDYHDLYLKTDVLLLADVFENFRRTCLKHYKLDPAHYYTSPGLAWDACLKETGQQLELLCDYDMLMMFERGIRGGMTHIAKRYSEANNKYMKDYDPDKPSKFIQYLDANNLYGWAMSQSLPVGGFRWMSNLSKEKVLDILEKANSSMNDMGKTGYIFEVDLEYPQELWKSHNDYPLAPEKMKVGGVEKLISHFKPHKKYVIHYRNLRQCLELGLKIKVVHRGISFNQSSWMEPYIRKNTELRKTAANSFEKDFFKLLNNSVFGKTIENIRKRQNVFLVDNREKASKLSCKPNFERATIFDRNLLAIHLKKTEIYFNKPVYVGQAILDLSKLLMFDFHYNYIQKKYSYKKARLLFTDTDSLMYELITEDFYFDIKDDIKARFDTSDYPPDHESGILTGVNKKVIGMFKDEVAGQQIIKFVGLRPKMYSFKIEDSNTTKKLKGIKKSVIKKKIEFEDYVDCLKTGKKQMCSMNIIRSENHEIYSKEVNKLALSRDDDKREVLEDKVHTKAIR